MQCSSPDLGHHVVYIDSDDTSDSDEDLGYDLITQELEPDNNDYIIVNLSPILSPISSPSSSPEQFAPTSPPTKKQRTTGKINIWDLPRGQDITVNHTHAHRANKNYKKINH